MRSGRISGAPRELRERYSLRSRRFLISLQTITKKQANANTTAITVIIADIYKLLDRQHWRYGQAFASPAKSDP
jgi:hypothetical protein